MKTLIFGSAIAAALALSASPSEARADEASSTSYAHSKDFGGRIPEVLLSAGVRGMINPSKGFDPYATNDVLLQSSFSVGVTFWRHRNVSTSASFEWDAGGKSANTRGQEISLFVHRLSIPLEARWQPTNRVALFVRAAPGANRLLAATEPQLRARNWSFGVDATGGAAFMLGKVKKARFWLTAEAGYSFAFSASMKLVYQPGDDEPPRHNGATALPDLSIGGGLARLGLGVSF